MEDYPFVLPTLGFLATLAAIAGIVLWIVGIPQAVYFCALFCFFNSVFQCILGGQRGLYSELTAVALGVLCGWIFKWDLFFSGAAAICIECASLGVIGWVTLIIAWISELFG